MHLLFQHCSGRNQMSLQVLRSTPDIRYPIKRSTDLLKKVQLVMFTFLIHIAISTRFKANLLCAMLLTVILYAGQTEEFLLRGLKRTVHSYWKCFLISKFLSRNICYQNFWHITLILSIRTLTKKMNFSACVKNWSLEEWLDTTILSATSYGSLQMCQY